MTISQDTLYMYQGLAFFREHKPKVQNPTPEEQVALDEYDKTAENFLKDIKKSERFDHIRQELDQILLRMEDSVTPQDIARYHVLTQEVIDLYPELNLSHC